MQTHLSLLLITIQLHTALNVQQPAKRQDKPATTTSPLIAALTKPERQSKFIPIQHQYYIPHHLLVIPSHSNVHHSQIHTNIHHLNSGNVRIPVLTQTVLHTGSNISHSTQLLPILLPVHNYYLHDVSVVPLRRQGELKQMSRYRLEKRNDNYDEEYAFNPFRNPIGGHGNGWHFGGHGAGHGYFT